ncbi:Carboxy-terminal domain (CTD) phosphatase, partial [Tulasnella sp. 427]
MATTSIYLPATLPYPVVITSIAAQQSTTVERGTKLLHYSFEFTPRRTYSPDPSVKAPAPKAEKRFSSWESTAEGVIQEWHIRSGQVITSQAAKETPALTILEPCSHSMQINGLCSQCGKDMTQADYIGIGDEARAGIQMNHGAAGPVVSSAEARRIEEESARRLKQARKLILIVDLDQTIVHATVDPTVGEWIAQGKAYENKLAEKAAAKAGKDVPRPKEDDDEDSDSSSDSEIEVNPNWETLKDVAQFKLASETAARRGRPAVKEEPCDYYIKPRPGLSTFLTSLKEKYEMHVYTMGEVEAAIVAAAQSKAVTSQLEERPLAKMQEKLDKDQEKEETKGGAPEPNGDSGGLKAHNGREITITTTTTTIKAKPSSVTMIGSWNILHEVHRRYYEAYDEKKANAIPGKGKQRGSLAKNTKVPDVIIPALKSEVLAGVRILFSSVIPLGTPPEQSEAWRCAREFGAKCATKLTDEVTHVVSAKEGTHKVLEAFHRGNVKVVWTKWFNDCIALWKHLEEKDDYLLPMPSKRTLEAVDATATPGSNPGNEPNGEEAGGNLKALDETGTPGTDTGTPVGTPRMPELDLDWQAAQDELDAFLAETDDEGGDDEKIDGDEDDEEDDDEKEADREGRDREFGAKDLDELLAEDEAMEVSYGEP